MTVKELLNNVELLNEMNETWLELVKLQTKLAEYCNNIQIDMVIKTLEDMNVKCEYLVIVVMEVYNKIPEQRENCETILLSIKDLSDGLKRAEKAIDNIGD